MNEIELVEYIADLSASLKLLAQKAKEPVLVYLLSVAALRAQEVLVERDPRRAATEH